MQASRNVDWSLLYSCQSRVDNFLFCSKSGHVLYIMQARWNAQTDPCHSLFSSPTVSQGMSYILCRQAGTQGPILAPLVKARLTFSSPTVSQDMSYILCRQAWTQGPILATLVKAGLTFSEADGRWVSQYFLPKLRRLLYFLFFSESQTSSHTSWTVLNPLTSHRWSTGTSTASCCVVKYIQSASLSREFEQSAVRAHVGTMLLDPRGLSRVRQREQEKLRASFTWSGGGREWG